MRATAWPLPAPRGCTDGGSSTSQAGWLLVGVVLVRAQVTSLLGRTQEWCQVRRWQGHRLSLEKPRVSSFFFLFDSELVCSGGVGGRGGVPEAGAGAVGGSTAAGRVAQETWVWLRLQPLQSPGLSTVTCTVTCLALAPLSPTQPSSRPF